MATRRTPGPTRTAEPPQPPAEKAPARRPAPAATPAPGTAGASTRITFSEEARRAMIEQAAYLRCERRGLAPGGEVEDWLAAEAEVDALLKATNGGPPQ